MSLFVCTTCQHIENTALGRYWPRLATGNPECSQCVTGTWHGLFPRERYDEERHGPIGEDMIVQPPERV